MCRPHSFMYLEIHNYKRIKYSGYLNAHLVKLSERGLSDERNECYNS